MRRRQVLTMCGASLVGLAGCGGSQESTEEAGTPTADPTRSATLTTEQTPTETTERLVEAASLQRAVFTRVDGGYGLYEAPDSQYLFLTGEGVTGDDPKFVYGGTEYSPGTSAPNPVTRAASEFSSETTDSGWAVFELPTATEATGAKLRNEDLAWQPDESLRTRLTAPITEVDVYDFEISVLEDGRPEFSFRAYNSGIHTSQFLGRIRRSNAAEGLEQVVSRTIPSKEAVTLTATAEEAGTPVPGSGISSSASYDLVWPDGRKFLTYPE